MIVVSELDCFTDEMMRSGTRLLLRWNRRDFGMPSSLTMLTDRTAPVLTAVMLVCRGKDIT